MSPDGVLVIDKPPGMTSHDVVDRVRRALSTRKVGHGGTLDPDATGVLVIGVGRATRFLSYSQAAPKTYRAQVKLGASTTTQDAAGEVIEERPVNVTAEQVERELSALRGEIDQTPPMVSAVRVGGERLYKKAARGEEVERPTRRVTIYDLELGSFEAPLVGLRVRCSGGTYVRTLAHDLGERLGCGAHLVSLRRTASGGFEAEEAIALDEVSPARLRPLIDIVRDLPQVELDEEGARLVSHGRALDGLGTDADRIAVSTRGRLLGVYRREADRYVADRVVSA